MDIEVAPAGNMRVRAMRRVFNWAMKQQPPLARTNPARDVGYLRRGSEGHHCWTLDEIRQYEKRHPSGTKARPALALFLYTGQRRSDVVRLGRQHSTRSGWFRFTQHKDRNRNPVTLEIPILPVLQKEIEAAPTGDLTFLVTEYGRIRSKGSARRCASGAKRLVSPSDARPMACARRARCAQRRTEPRLISSWRSSAG
jgi:integrase